MVLIENAGGKTLAPDTPNIPLTEFDCVMTDADPLPPWSYPQVIHNTPYHPVSHNHRLRHDLEQSENIIGFMTSRGRQQCLTCYN